MRNRREGNEGVAHDLCVFWDVCCPETAQSRPFLLAVASGVPERRRRRADARLSKLFSLAAEVLARAQESLDAAKLRRRGSFHAYRPSIEREALRRENIRATDEIVAALNERRIFLAYESVVSTADRRAAFYECLMRIRRTDGSLVAADDIAPVAERLGLVRLLDFRVIELVVD